MIKTRQVQKLVMAKHLMKFLKMPQGVLRFQDLEIAQVVVLVVDLEVVQVVDQVAGLEAVQVVDQEVTNQEADLEVDQEVVQGQEIMNLALKLQQIVK